MRNGWTIKPLGEVGIFQRGGGFLKNDFVEDGFPCIHYGQIHTVFGVATEKHLKCIPKTLALNKSKLATTGDVILAITSEDVECSCKCTAWLGNYDIAIGSHAAIYHHNLNPKFVSYYFRGPFFNRAKQKFTHGIKVIEIKPSDIATICIAYPSLDEQTLIVEELDLLNNVIAEKESQLNDLDALAQSIFYEMFGDPVSNEKGWPVKAIKESVEEMFLGPFGSSLKTDSYVPKEQSYCMVYEQKHAIKKTLKQDNHYINKDKFNLLKRFSVGPGDFIMSCRGTIGEIFELPKDAPNGIIHPSLMKIRLKEGVYSHEFFKVVLKQVVAKQEMNGGVVKMAVTAKKLGQIQIVAPPMDAQIEFNRKIEKIEEQKELIKQSISDMQTLLDKRMSDYFN